MATRSTNGKAATTKRRRTSRTSQKKTATVDNLEINAKGDMNTAENGVKLETMSNETEKSVPLPPLPGNRPIDSSNLEVHSTLDPREKRPVVSSKMGISETYMVSGNRPVAHSTINFDNTMKIMGNRPIASNNIDDDDLMGYLD
ncbi:MAG: hypothetical protein AB4352_17120 [Hormoscilla sp.]